MWMPRTPLLMAGMLALSLGTLPHAAMAQDPVPLAFVQPLPPAAVVEVQQRLRDNGVYTGAVDGKWGPDSQAALDRFQQGRGLQVTGSINQATAQALGLDSPRLLAGRADPPAANVPLSGAAVRNIQSRLKALGFYSGGIDGTWGPGTQRGLERFQQGQGLQPNGQATPATVQALGLDPNNLAAAPRR